MDEDEDEMRTRMARMGIKMRMGTRMKMRMGMSMRMNG